MQAEADPCVVVIFGASGDLTARKLIPALFDMAVAGALSPKTCVLGVSRSDMADEAWRTHLEPWVREHANRFDAELWSGFSRRLHYIGADATDAASYPGLIERITSLNQANDCSGNVLLYLAVAPRLYEPIIACIDGSGLVAEGRRWCAIDRDNVAWVRVIVEKPFGHDLDSARSLNQALGRVFDEDAIYRIDHYLGKELVQSLLVFRFANTIFEPVWNHQHIDHVQITAAETVGVGHRAGYYDGVGAIRDMIQSHLLQVMALVAMEPPTSFAAHAIRQEKIKLIDAIVPMPADRLHETAVLGQYDASEDEPAFHLHPDVRRDTTTETYAAVVLCFDNWRWANTPFFVRTGKRMAAKRTEIVIHFKQPPASLFRHLKKKEVRPANRIIIEIAPRGGVSLRFEGKVPGSGLRRETVTMDFDYADRFAADPDDSYGPLLIDAMRGDQSLFQHRYDVEGSWRAIAPLIGPESAALRQSIHANYAAGSWGPDGAERLLAAPHRHWHD